MLQPIFNMLTPWRLVAKILGPGNRIVTILCDSGTRHLSKFWKRAGSVGGKQDTSLEQVISPALASSH
jgi:hypothetical protein